MSVQNQLRAGITGDVLWAVWGRIFKFHSERIRVAVLRGVCEKCVGMLDGMQGIGKANRYR